MARPCLALVGCALALLAGCQTVERLPPLAQTPNLIGVWEGAWGDTPLTLAIVEQTNDRIAGVLTYALPEGVVSTNVKGRLGHRAGVLALQLTVETTRRYDVFDFGTVAADRLEGSGAIGGTFPATNSRPVALRRRT